MLAKEKKSICLSKEININIYIRHLFNAYRMSKSWCLVRARMELNANDRNKNQTICTFHFQVLILSVCCDVLIFVVFSLWCCAYIWEFVLYRPNIANDEEKYERGAKMNNDHNRTIFRYDNCMQFNGSWNVLLMNVMCFFFFLLVHSLIPLYSTLCSIECDLINWICLCRLEPFGIWILNIVVISTFCCCCWFFFLHSLFVVVV